MEFLHQKTAMFEDKTFNLSNIHRRYEGCGAVHPPIACAKLKSLAEWCGDGERNMGGEGLTVLRNLP